MSVAKKILPIVNGVAGFPIDMQEVLYCSMLQANGTVYMDDGTTIDDIEDAMSKGKLVVCRFIPGDQNAEPVTLIGVNNVFPVRLRGICKNSSNMQVVTAYGQESNNTDVWTVKTISVAPQVNADWNATGGAAQILNKPTIPTIDTALSETSTNPVQNKAINVLTRKLWQRVDIVSRLGNEYPTTRNYITSGHWTSSTTYKHWAVPVDGMRAATVTANSSQYAIISFLKTYNSTSGTPDFATGYNGNSTVDAGKTRIFNVPEDANWMIVMTGSSNARKPSHIYLTSVAANHPRLTYIQLAPGATSCDISLTDTKQSFVIDNSENSNHITINITNLYDKVYSNEYLAGMKGMWQFDFESVESEHKVYLFVKQTALFDRTPS